MIIDCHQHLWSGERALAEMLEACDTAGIARTCVSACGGNFRQPENGAVRAAFEAYPDRILGFGYVRLGLDGPNVVDCLADEGFSGIKVINPLLPYNDDFLMPVYERTARLGLPILFHTGVVATMARDAEFDVCSDRMRPILLDRIARRFPALKIIGAHLGVPWWDEALAMIYRHPNVWYDCTGAITRLKTMPQSFFDGLFYWSSFPGKWLFGTDCAYRAIPKVLEDHREFMRRLRLNEPEQAEILGGRMEALLKR